MRTVRQLKHQQRPRQQKQTGRNNLYLIQKSELVVDFILYRGSSIANNSMECVAWSDSWQDRALECIIASLRGKLRSVA